MARQAAEILDQAGAAQAAAPQTAPAPAPAPGPAVTMADNSRFINRDFALLPSTWLATDKAA